MGERRSSTETTGIRSATRPNWGVLALLLLALIAAAPLWTGPGLVNTRSGGDSPFLIIRLHQLAANLRAGIFPARWMPDAAYGLGYPFFNFYAALPYYLAAAFNLIGFDLLASIKIVQSLGFIFAAGAMYAWAKPAFGGAAGRAWLAAVAYTFAPFHLVNVYVRGDSLSEFYAFVFFPLILRSVDRLTERPGARPIAQLALAYAGLILTHNVSALIFSPFVLLYTVIRNWRSEIGGSLFAIRNLKSAIVGLVLGLLVSAWFWLPALGEASLVQLDAQTTGYFNYNEHFRAANLIQPSLLFNYDTEPPHTPFAMGFAQTLATLAGTLILIRRRESTPLRLFTLAGLFLSTVMITPLSKPLWDTLPLLPLAQFPWRFLSVQAVFTSLVIGYLGARATSASGVSASGASASGDASYKWVGVALAASMLLTLRPDYLAIRADEITPEQIQLYESFTTNVGTTIRAEYLPRTTVPRPYTGPQVLDPDAPPHAIPIRGEAQADRVAITPTTQVWSVRTAGDATLAFPTVYFPGWGASVDGQPAEPRAAADLGYIEVDVPSGEHTVRLSFERTPLRAASEIISLAAMGCVLAMFFVRRKPLAKLNVSPIAHVFRRRYEIALLVLAVILAAIATATHPVEARDDDLTMDFESQPWLHHGAIDFGAARLLRYAYAGPLRAGAPFSVTLTWDGRPSAEAVAIVQLVAPSQHVFNGPEPLAGSQAPVRAGDNTYTLNAPEKLAPGVYYVRVEATQGLGQTRAVFLKPVRYLDPISVPETAGWARINQAIKLEAVRLQHSELSRLTVALDWRALKPIAANYAVSLRLHDSQGHVWSTLDTQPGYGFQPTSAWRPGEDRRDGYTLTLPPDMPREETYALDVVWYRVASQQEVGRVRVPGVEVHAPYAQIEMLPPARNFDLPPMQQRVAATFGDVIQLAGYDLAQAGGRLTLSLHWQALADIGADYKFFVHVFDPATERIVAQVDAMPGGNAYPTSRWVEDEVVSEVVDLDVTAPGTYRLAVGWYDPISRDRLPALDQTGEALPANRFLINGEMVIP